MKNIITGIGVLIAIAAGVYLFMQRDAAQLVFDDAGATAGALASTQVFIERRALLESITLDTSIVDDERSTSLRSYTRPLLERPTGRPNPFEPPTAIIVPRPTTN